MFMFLVWISESLVVWKRPVRSLSLPASNYLIYHSEPRSAILRNQPPRAEHRARRVAFPSTVPCFISLGEYIGTILVLRLSLSSRRTETNKKAKNPRLLWRYELLEVVAEERCLPVCAARSWPWAPRLTCGIHYSCVVFVLISGPLLDFIMFVLSVSLGYLPLACIPIKLCPQCSALRRGSPTLLSVKPKTRYPSRSQPSSEPDQQRQILI